MKKTVTCLLLTTVALSLQATPVANRQKTTGGPQLTVLEKIDTPDGNSLQIVRDAKGRVYKQRVAKGESARPLPTAPRRENSNAERTFYEGFEGYVADFGLNWIPEGWTKINTEAHTPTEEQIAHNINNSWYVYYSSDLYQEMTTDGQSEAFIHFGYEGNYGANSKAQDEWLVSPAVTLGDNETLRFMQQAEPMSTYDFDWSTMKFDRSRAICNMQVMLTTDGGENWTCIWDYEKEYASKLNDSQCYDEPSSYHDFAVSLAEYAGKSVKVAFRYLRDEGNYIGNSMMVDAVVIDHPAGGDGWTLLGTGTMADGWVIPALTPQPGDYYSPSDYVFDVKIYESTANPGVYRIESPYTSENFPFLSLNDNTTPHDIIIDASNPEFVVVEPQESGFEHNNPGSKAARYAAPYYISHAGKYFLDEGNEIPDIISYGYASTFDAENGKITITNPQYGHKKADGTLDMGYSCGPMGAEEPTVITLPTAAPEPAWETLGMATLVDGFIYPGFYGDPKGHGWEVEILTREDQPGVYMMKDPYTCDASPLSMLNETENTVMIKVDASNPNLVVVTPQYAGIGATVDGEYMPFYIGNKAGWYVAYGTSASDLDQYFDDSSKDKLVNGVITFDNGNALFGSDAGEGFGYNWVDAAGNPMKYAAKLYLPGTTETPDPADPVGIDSINSENGVSVYYSLDGIRLQSAPLHGPYIKVTDGRATKVIRR